MRNIVTSSICVLGLLSLLSCRSEFSDLTNGTPSQIIKTEYKLEFDQKKDTLKLPPRHDRQDWLVQP